MPPSTSSGSSTAVKTTTRPVKVPCWCGDDCQCCIIPCSVM
ncbi:hypothetical protein CB0940_01784 [Cercospora beticola]|uniref:Uncharacterized protein n=1 Tax=Cercospora beticola TaxID=122368 RepID=A0A2G5IBZ0_CERBT|nr:hypothetical protein CB0940_01784 [Cercospora beticola]PIB01993.1 hypothetical protein CB0940_01784 [Cercospora beticola]